MTNDNNKKEIVPATAVQLVPSDWKPIDVAPFYYSRSGHLRSPQDWKGYIRENIDVPGSANCSWEDGRQNIDVQFDDKGIEVAPDIDRLLIVVTFDGYLSLVDGQYGLFGVSEDDSGDEYHDCEPLIIGRPNAFIADFQEYAKDRQWPEPAIEHCKMLKSLWTRLRLGFSTALERGHAVIMARPNTVFAPFEAIPLDQFRYFRMSSASELGPPDANPFWSTGYPGDHHRATGPAGEMLFSIYVAPGADHSAGPANHEPQDPRDKCQQWMRGLLQEFPDRGPKPNTDLFKDAAERFAGLSKRAAAECLRQAQKIEQNFNWSKPGAPKQSQRKSMQKK